MARCSSASSASRRWSLRASWCPGDVAEGAEQDLQPAQFLGQEGVAARGGDQVVQPAIDGAGLGR